VKWLTRGEEIRAILRAGFDVVFHCRGGLGRAGTMAAKTLVEFGLHPDWAIDELRRVRPGAIETQEQERIVERAQSIPESVPETSPTALKDRAVGALLGLAIGDAVGTTLEFTRPAAAAEKAAADKAHAANSLRQSNPEVTAAKAAAEKAAAEALGHPMGGRSVLLRQKAILRVGPLQWGRIKNPRTANNRIDGA